MSNALATYVPKEITEYKPKLVLGLTLRQAIGLLCAIVCGAAVFFLFRQILDFPMDIASYITMAAAFPALSVGFLRPGGLNFEQYARNRYSHYICVKKRTHKNIKILDKEATRRNEIISKTAQARGKQRLFECDDETIQNWVQEQGANAHGSRKATRQKRSAAKKRTGKKTSTSR
ncbi:MAG: PrgI family protein [Oscillospiraceae bacterium]|nr:PrgI family protein [Oscillospiraceae bacterium]